MAEGWVWAIRGNLETPARSDENSVVEIKLDLVTAVFECATECVSTLDKEAPIASSQNLVSG